MSAGQKGGWSWWAGRDDEYMNLGDYDTREDAIVGGKEQIGEGEGDFVVCEATSLTPPPLDADTIVDAYFNDLGDNSDYYSGESDYPDWSLKADEQKAPLAELQAFLTAWSERYLIPNMPAPDRFGQVRNMETISNTVDPDMLPGGHDNPRGEA